jgi:hypothetical protein
MAVGHVHERAIPFVRDDSKQVSHFLLRQHLDEAILPS